jgi:hypothetical protein
LELKESVHATKVKTAFGRERCGDFQNEVQCVTVEIDLVSYMMPAYPKITAVTFCVFISAAQKTQSKL